MGEERTIIVCNWRDCPFVADATSRFAETYDLTPREREVLVMVVDGMSVAGIAEELVISPGTVKAHLHRIYRRVGVSGRAELMRAYASFGRS